VTLDFPTLVAVAVSSLAVATGLALRRQTRTLRALQEHVARLEAEATARAAPAPELPIVVIAAAIAAVLARPHRIVQVRHVTAGWSLEGRRQQLVSHQLR
jgi:hypothetical protein